MSAIGTANLTEIYAVQTAPGVFTVLGATPGRQSFATAISRGMASPFFANVQQPTGQRLWFEGRATLSGNVLTFTQISANSAGGTTALDVSSGSVIISNQVPAESLVYLNQNRQFSNNGGVVNDDGLVNVNQYTYQQGQTISAVTDWSPVVTGAQTSASNRGASLVIPGIGSPMVCSTAGTPSQSPFYAFAPAGGQTTVWNGVAPIISAFFIADQANLGILNIEPTHGQQISGIVVRNMSFDGNEINQPETPHQHNFRIQTGYRFHVSDIWSDNSKGYGVGMQNTASSLGYYQYGILENVWVNNSYNDGIDFKNAIVAPLTDGKNEGIHMSKWFVTNMNYQQDRDNAGYDIRMRGGTFSQLYALMGATAPCDGFRFRNHLPDTAHTGARFCVGYGILINQNLSYLEGDEDKHGPAVGFAMNGEDNLLLGCLTWNGSTIRSYGGRIESYAQDSWIAVSRATDVVNGWQISSDLPGGTLFGCVSKNTTTGFDVRGAAGGHVIDCCSNGAVNGYNVEIGSTYLDGISAANTTDHIVQITTNLDSSPYIRVLDFSFNNTGGIGSDVPAIWDWGSSPPSIPHVLTGTAAAGDNLLNNYESGQILRGTSGGSNRVWTVPRNGGKDSSGREQEYVLMKFDGAGTTIQIAVSNGIGGGTRLTGAVLTTKGQAIRIRWLGGTSGFDGTGWYYVFGY